MLKFIKPDKTADFEATVNKLQEALTQSSNPERRQQAQSWRVFKAIEPATNGDAVYVFEIDPAVRGADYTVARILAEAFPADAQSVTAVYSLFGLQTTRCRPETDCSLRGGRAR